MWKIMWFIHYHKNSESPAKFESKFPTIFSVVWDTRQRGLTWKNKRDDLWRRISQKVVKSRLLECNGAHQGAQMLFSNWCQLCVHNVCICVSKSVGKTILICKSQVFSCPMKEAKYTIHCFTSTTVYKHIFLLFLFTESMNMIAH